MRAYLEDNGRDTWHEYASVTAIEPGVKIEVSLAKFKPKAYFEDNEFIIEVESIREYLDIMAKIEGRRRAMEQYNTSTVQSTDSPMDLEPLSPVYGRHNNG